MAGKLSPSATVRYSTISGFADRVHRVHSLVEQYAVAKGAAADNFAVPIGRAFARLKLQFMGAGLDTLSQLCGSMEIAARRGVPQHSKVRILREGVGSLKFQLELELRTIVSDDQAEQRRRQEREESEGGR